MTVQQLINKLLLCRSDAVVLTDHKEVLTDYLQGDTMTEILKVFQGIAYKTVDDAPGGQWIDAEPFNDQYEQEPGVAAVYLGNGGAIKEPLWERK